MKKITIGDSVYFKIGTVSKKEDSWDCPICSEKTGRRTSSKRYIMRNSIRDQVEVSITGENHITLCKSCSTSLSSHVKYELDARYGSPYIGDFHDEYEERYKVIEDIAETWIPKRYEALFLKEKKSKQQSQQ